jgi:hypothetical protein
VLCSRLFAALCAFGLAACGSMSPPGSCSLEVSIAHSLPPATSPPATCGSGGLMSALGKNQLLVGYAGDDSVASQAPFDLRYQYIAGGVSPGTSPCTDCNAAGCGSWWGCWQDWSKPPGLFVSNFATQATKDGEIPMFSYYQLLQTIGYQYEGSGEVAKANDLSVMSRYFDDYRFMLQQIGGALAFVHIEPDFWGYAEHAAIAAATDAHGVPAQVGSANPTDCSGVEDSIAGLGRCMIAMVRSYAPNAKVGLHASGWGTNWDVLLNSDPSFDVVAHGQELGEFLVSCGASLGDFVVADMSDRDAGYYQSIGRNTWWDSTNTKLPNFTQAFTWATAVADTVGLPILWWQVPVGNMCLAPANRDNRVDYLFAHTDQVTAARAIGMAFGAGAAGQATPSTDGGDLVDRTKVYAQTGGAPICP